jgi:retron-type reverse transcriptase
MAEKDIINSDGGKITILANFLASALDIEEEISNSVYKDYVDAKNWPKNLKPEVFQNIRQYLNTLIEDTQKHKKIIRELIEQYGGD